MGDYCKTINLKVEVQENGIIRLKDNGRYIGRLDEDEEVNFEKLQKMTIAPIPETLADVEIVKLQSLCVEETELLNCLRTKYDCAIAVFNKYTQKWCLIGRNSNDVICTLSGHLLTLNRDMIHELDDICPF